MKYTRFCLIFIISVSLLMTGCGNRMTREEIGTRSFGSQTGLVEEISFRSGKFRLVGDLRLPEGEGPFPAVILVHGSGGATRQGAVPYKPLIEIFLRNGFAVFSWDKPGSGDSRGNFRNEISERADILVDGVGVLAEHSLIDPAEIGVWGISMAGWIMPLAIDASDQISFMIVVGGGAEDSIEQMAYQLGQRVICAGGSQPEADLVDSYWSQKSKAEEYSAYLEAMEYLVDVQAIKYHINTEIEKEKSWKPTPRDWDSFIDPMDTIEHTTIPVLVFYGELDRNIDPVQGATAYKAALESAGNEDYRIEVLSGVAHTLTPAETGCLNEAWGIQYAPEYLEVLESWIQEH